MDLNGDKREQTRGPIQSVSLLSFCWFTSWFRLRSHSRSGLHSGLHSGSRSRSRCFTSSGFRTRARNQGEPSEWTAPKGAARTALKATSATPNQKRAPATRKQPEASQRRQEQMFAIVYRFCQCLHKRPRLFDSAESQANADRRPQSIATSKR